MVIDDDDLDFRAPQLLDINPRPAGPLDFPPPAGGGAFERPPHDLGSWSP